MSEKTYTFRAYLSKLKQARKDLIPALASACEEATKAAVKATMDATPPKAGTGRGPYIGTNTITGQLKQHWATDSTIKPEITAGSVKTVLANDLEYASYVNDGHRMDRHFVPGLYINDAGILEYDPSRKEVGIMVGTKTKYVKGEFMVDKGREAYQKTLEPLLEAKVRELLG